MDIIPFYKEGNYGSQRLNKFGQKSYMWQSHRNGNVSASPTFLSFLKLSGAFSMFSEDLKSFNFLITKAICCCCLVAKSCLTLFWPCGLQPTMLLCPWIFPRKNTGVGCHFLLKGIFLTQGSNLPLLHWPAVSLLLSHQGSPIKAILDYNRKYVK